MCLKFEPTRLGHESTSCFPKLSVVRVKQCFHVRACHLVSLVSRLPEHLLRLLDDLGSPLLLDDEVLSELEHEHRGVR